MSSNGQTPLPAHGASDRPFYFIVVLWGEQFRHCFIEFCLASLLSPGNIPALDPSRRGKFLIATRPDDWAALQKAGLFQLLKRYVEPIYIEIPPCPPGRSSYQHMSIGHRIACDMAHRDKAYAVVLTPDCMLSEGSVARLQELARDGTQLVLTAALRFGEEPFLAHLRERGLLPDENQVADSTPLVISGRQMVYAAVNGFHSETLAYEWDAPGIMAISPAAWWRVPGEDGIVLHSLSWAPLLLDYGAIDTHDTSTFDQWTLDGDYLFNNSKTMTRIHVVQDSDEVFLASWGPLAERPMAKTRFPFEDRLAGHFFRQSFYSGFFDPFKRKLFFLPVRWHAKPLSETWNEVEQRAMSELLEWVQPPNQEDPAHKLSPAERLRNFAMDSFLTLIKPFAYLGIYRERLGQYARGLLRGDREQLRRIVWFVRTFMLSRHAS